MKPVLEETTKKITSLLGYKVDIYVKLHIKPKPKYLPKFIWNWLLKKLLILDQFNK